MFGCFGWDERIVGNDLHAERSGAMGDEATDATEADNAERLVFEFDAFPLGAFQRPSTRAPCACGTLRACASRSAIVCSAAEVMFDSGALTTMTPLAVAAAVSTLSRPTPARPTTASDGPAAAISSASTCVAERTMSPDARRWPPEFLRRQSGADIHLVAGRPEGVQTGIGDLFSDEDTMHQSSWRLAVGQPPEFV